MEPMQRMDLHTHSTASDGTFSPEELIEEAVRKELAAIALTDHDTVAGIKTARSAALDRPIEFIPGVELSTDYKENEVHIVGLFIDETNEELQKCLQDFRKERLDRDLKMYAALQKEGFDISKEAVEAMFPDSVVTRAHIARFLVEKKYIPSMSVAFEKYIGDNCKCYIARERISSMKAVEIINKAGGAAVLAHPILYHMSDARLRELIRDCKEAGLRGIEAIYSTYQTGEEHYIRRLAKEYSLSISGGSDFHGTNKPSIALGMGHGNLFVPYEILSALRPM